MASGADATRDNWQALRRLAGLLFACLRRENPDWNLEDLERHLELPRTRLFQELGQEAGFEPRSTLSAADENRILKTMLRGVFSPEEIARETELRLPRVKEFLEKTGVPFDAGGWGMFPWPGERDGQEGPASKAEPRRISKKGQFSYKGRTYGIGSLVANRTCWVEEAGSRLVVHFSDRPAMMVPKRA